MPRDLRAYLWDVLEASNDIQSFAVGQTLSSYAGNPMLQAAVERKFEIIGEALAQLKRHFPHLVSRVSNYDQIIAFRNRLIHGYSTVSDALVWDVVENGLPRLKQEADELLKEADSKNP
jgi:uncharacterized protein with HEPN domain